ncbi:MAG: Omp28-related outer membrane protein [Porphyromonadaceae bacterium]|nr:Omp28-related outer membrane protein [Porphyromonadaceae bacterium]
MTKNLDANFNGYLHTQTIPHKSIKANAWNTVRLDKDLEIEKDTPLYIGVVMTYSNAIMPALKCCYEKGFREEGGNFYLDKQKWIPLERLTPIDYNFAVYAYAEGDNAPAHDVGIRRLSSADFVAAKSSTNATFLLRNYSREHAKNVVISAKSDGKEFQRITIDTIDIATGLERRITMGGVKFPTEGNHELELSVISVNGGDDTKKLDNTVSKPIFAVREGGQMLSKKILFEQFTAESHHAMPIADSLYAVSINKGKDAIWIKHHIYDDAYSLPYVKEYEMFFEDRKTFLPAIAVNRDIYPSFRGERGPAYFINGESFTDLMIDYGLAFPAFVSVKGKVQLNEQTADLKVMIEGKSEAKELPFAQAAYLTVYLVEDGIRSTTQTGRKEYIQDGVVRAVLSDTWGDEIDLSGYSYRKEYITKIDKTWKKENLRIVAFVADYGGEYDKLRVHNTEEFKVMTSDSNEGVLDKAVAKVWYTNGAIQISEGFDVVAVYDLAGRRIPNHTNLAPGQYIVQLSGESSLTAHKLLVK